MVIKNLRIPLLTWPWLNEIKKPQQLLIGAFPNLKEQIF
jgi:hypothetical protein